MTDAPLAASVGAGDMVQVMQPGGFALATVDQIVAAPTVAIKDLAARVAALEGKPAANVVLSSALPVATLQMGSVDLPIAVPGLLRTDTVTVEIEADLPAGLDIRAAHPARDRDGILVVQAIASLAVALTAAIPIRVVAER